MIYYVGAEYFQRFLSCNLDYSRVKLQDVRESQQQVNPKKGGIQLRLPKDMPLSQYKRKLLLFEVAEAAVFVGPDGRHMTCQDTVRVLVRMLWKIGATRDDTDEFMDILRKRLRPVSPPLKRGSVTGKDEDQLNSDSCFDARSAEAWMEARFAKACGSLMQTHGVADEREVKGLRACAHGGNEPIHLAAQQGHTAMVKFLSEMAPDTVYAAAEGGHLPIHCAARNGHAAVVKLLSGLAPGMTLTPDNDGHLPVHCAASGGHSDAAKLLNDLAPQATMTPDNDGLLPVQIAAQLGHGPVVDVLSPAYPGPPRGYGAVVEGLLQLLKETFPKSSNDPSL